MFEAHLHQQVIVTDKAQGWNRKIFKAIALLDGGGEFGEGGLQAMRFGGQ